MSSLTNALRVLAMFDADRTELRVTDVARTLDLPKSSVSRLLNELARAGMVERDTRGRGFRAGPELFRLGNLYRLSMSVEERIERVCLDLLRRFPATAYLGVLRGCSLVILRRLESAHPVRYILEPGDTIPAYTTALGKALLARVPEAELVELLPPHLHSEDRDVDMPREAMIAELRLSARRGYAVLADRKLQVGAVAVAVRVAPARELGFALSYALGAIGEEERAALTGELLEAARDVGVLCADPYWTG